MVFRYSFYFNRIFVFFFIPFFLSCGLHQNQSSEGDLSDGEHYYPKISILRNISKKENEKNNFHIILKGEYENCIGKINGSDWSISSDNSLIENLLMVKKGNKECLLSVTEITIKNIENSKNILANINLSLRSEDNILKNSFFNSPYLIELKSEDQNKLIQSIYLNIKLLNHNFLDTPKIEVHISDHLNHISQSASHLKAHLEIESVDQEEAISIDHGSFGFKKFKIINKGDIPVSFNGFFSENIFNNTCEKMKNLHVGDDCTADLLFISRSLNEEIFKISLNYSYKDYQNFSEKKIFKIRSSVKDSIDSSDSLDRHYIYKSYSSGETIFAISQDLKDPSKNGLFYSNNGPSGDFKKAKGIEDGIEIRGVTAFGDTIYVIAYNGKTGIHAKGGLYFSKSENNEYAFNKVKNFKSQKLQNISSDGNILYIVTSDDGLYFLKNAESKEFEKVKVENNNYIYDIFIYENKVFAISEEYKYEKFIYYTENGDKGKLTKKYKLDLDEKSITSIAMNHDKIFIGTTNGLFQTNLEFNTLDKINIFEGQNIKNMLSVGTSIYVAVSCDYKSQVQNCSKSGIYYAGLEISPEFKMILNIENPLGIFASGGTIYISSIGGFKYLGNYHSKQIQVGSENLNQNFVHSHFNEDTLYLVKSGADGEIFSAPNGGKGFNGNKDLFQKKEIKMGILHLPHPQGIIASLNSFKDDFYAVVNNNSKYNGLWHAKNDSEMTFSKIHEPQLRNRIPEKFTSVFPLNDRVYLATEDLIKYSIFKNGSYSEFIKLNRDIFEGKIKNIFVLNKIMYIATSNSIYYGELVKKSGTFKESVIFKKSSFSFPKMIFIKSLYISGNSIYVATNKGLWYSSSGINGNYQKVNAFGENEIRSVSVIGNIVYVVKPEGLFSVTISDYVRDFNNKGFDPQISVHDESQQSEINVVNAVFALGNSIYVGTNNGISVSKNGGRNFKNISLGSEYNSCNRILYYKKVIYAATKNGLFISYNNGDSFEEYLSEYTKQKFINDIVEYDNKIYFSTNNGVFYLTPEDMLVKIIDSKSLNGKNIKRLYSHLNEIYAITAKGKLYFTKDGIHFGKFNEEALERYKISNIFVSSNEIYLGTNQGLVISKDFGKSFHLVKLNSKKSNVSEDISKMNQINGIYKASSVLYVATDFGIFASTDGGESFLNLNKEHGLGSQRVNDIFVQLVNIPGFSLGVYAATEKGLAFSEM